MIITFLVGNGFDISAGVNTSYEAFYKWYIDQPDGTDGARELKKELKEDIAKNQETEEKTWADFEIGLGQYTGKFTLDTIDRFIELYEDAHESMIEYIQQEVGQFVVDDFSAEDLKKMRTALANFYRELSAQEVGLFSQMFESDKGRNTVVNFISFNYTNVLDKCTELLSKEPLKSWIYNNQTERRFTVNPNVVHVHGAGGRYPILGVNDESQIANKDLLSNPRFAEIMIKPQSVTAIGEFWHRDAEKMIDESNIICIWGMSIGESDLRWWEKIINWLKADNSRHLIIFSHTTEDIGTISIFKRRTAIDKVQKTLTRYSTLNSEELEKIANRIHVIINTQTVLRIALKEKELALSK